MWWYWLAYNTYSCIHGFCAGWVSCECVMWWWWCFLLCTPHHTFARDHLVFFLFSSYHGMHDSHTSYYKNRKYFANERKLWVELVKSIGLFVVKSLMAFQLAFVGHLACLPFLMIWHILNEHVYYVMWRYFFAFVRYPFLYNYCACTMHTLHKILCIS